MNVVEGGGKYDSRGKYLPLYLKNIERRDV